MRSRLTLCVLMALFAVSRPSAQTPLSTAFTYQGHLKDAGTPADGLYDFRFRLFDAADGGTQIGATLCFDGVDVVDGLFSIQLDFGQQFATTAERYLDIQVRREIGQPCTDDFGYVLLSPRQQITATPLASHANSAFALDAKDGSPASAVIVDNTGNVGIGTTAPTARLDVRGDIRLGSSGQFRAAAGEENLRIIRGSIGINGQVLRGSGFTAQRIDVGKYRINLNIPSFASTPSVTAMAERGLEAHVGSLESGSQSPTGFTVVTFSLSQNDHSNIPFDFIAVGPR